MQKHLLLSLYGWLIGIWDLYKWFIHKIIPVWSRIHAKQLMLVSLLGCLSFLLCPWHSLIPILCPMRKYLSQILTLSPSLWENLKPNMFFFYQLVVSTPLKNISQNGNLPRIGVNIKKKLKPPSSLVFLILAFLSTWKNNEHKIAPKNPWKYGGELSNIVLHKRSTIQEANISPTIALLKMMFLFQRLDMLLPWRVLGKLPVMCTFFSNIWWVINPGSNLWWSSPHICTWKSLATIFSRLVKEPPFLSPKWRRQYLTYKNVGEGNATGLL